MKRIPKFWWDFKWKDNEIVAIEVESDDDKFPTIKEFNLPAFQTDVSRQIAEAEQLIADIVRWQKEYEEPMTQPSIKDQIEWMTADQVNQIRSSLLGVSDTLTKCAILAGHPAETHEIAFVVNLLCDQAIRALASLTPQPTPQEDGLLPCRKCGSKSVEYWDGRGTQASLSCRECGAEEGLQVSDLFEHGDERRFLPLLPPEYKNRQDVIDVVNAELRKEWNQRTPSVAQPVVETSTDIKIRHRCSTCLRDFSSLGSCIVHCGNYHSRGGFGEYDKNSHPIAKPKDGEI